MTNIHSLRFLALLTAVAMLLAAGATAAYAVDGQSGQKPDRQAKKPDKPGGGGNGGGNGGGKGGGKIAATLTLGGAVALTTTGTIDGARLSNLAGVSARMDFSDNDPTGSCITFLISQHFNDRDKLVSPPDNDGTADGAFDFDLGSGSINIEDEAENPVNWTDLAVGSSARVRSKVGGDGKKRTETVWLLRFSDNHAGSHRAVITRDEANRWTVTPGTTNTISIHNNWAQQTDFGVCTPSSLVWTITTEGLQ